MIFIAHRGNMFGPNPTSENNPKYLKKALDAGFEIETDIWLIDGKYWLGHDKPVYETTGEFLSDKCVWCHAKNLAAMNEVPLAMNVFWHDIDMYTLTSRGHIWGYPQRDHGTPCDIIAIRANLRFTNMKENLPERYIKYKGICSDYIVDVKENLSK